jgi:hypothetical protein
MVGRLDASANGEHPGSPELASRFYASSGRKHALIILLFQWRVATSENVL